MSDGFLFDALHHRIRTDVLVEDEYGRKAPGGTACRILDYENIATLQVLVSLITQNRGNAITVGEHGVLPDGLRALPRYATAQLVRNWISRQLARGDRHQDRTRSTHRRDRRAVADPVARHPRRAGALRLYAPLFNDAVRVRCPSCQGERIVTAHRARAMHREGRVTRCQACRGQRSRPLVPTKEHRAWAAEAWNAWSPAQREQVVAAFSALAPD